MALASYTTPFSARFQRMLTYRSAALAGFTAQCWWGTLKVMIFVAFYRDARPGSLALSLTQTISYVWLGQALYGITPRIADPDVSASVRDGSVALDRLRPIDTYWYWFARASAWLLGTTALRFGLLLPFSLLLLPAVGLGAWALAPPANAGSLACSVLSLALGGAVSAATMMIANAYVVRSGSDRGVNAILMTTSIVLSGNEVPLLLFPDWAHAFLFVQPLAGVFDTPVRIYCGALHGAPIASALALQALWLVVLCWIGRRALTAALLHMEVQGG